MAAQFFMVAASRHIQTKRSKTTQHSIMYIIVTSQIISTSTKLVLARAVKGSLRVVTEGINAAVVDFHGTLVDI